MSMRQIVEELKLGYRSVYGRIRPEDQAEAREWGLLIHISDFGVYAATPEWVINYRENGGLWSYTD